MNTAKSIAKCIQNASYRKPANVTRIEQRVCLACGFWMRSTCSAHRICNQCKGEHPHKVLRVGDRIRPVKGFETSDPWAWEAANIEWEFSNVLHLNNGGQR